MKCPLPTPGLVFRQITIEHTQVLATAYWVLATGNWVLATDH
ncbi:MAG: hypothetical protein ACLPPV_21670 [Candidatus Korobacteraceae bacterium]